MRAKKQMPQEDIFLANNLFRLVESDYEAINRN